MVAGGDQLQELLLPCREGPGGGAAGVQAQRVADVRLEQRGRGAVLAGEGRAGPAGEDQPAGDARRPGKRDDQGLVDPVGA
jgi:hypothetical protein